MRSNGLAAAKKSEDHLLELSVVSAVMLKVVGIGNFFYLT